LGITESARARPWQAAFVSAGSFITGASAPLLAIVLAPRGGPEGGRIAVIAGVGLALLAVTGAVGGQLGGASPRRAALRVLAGGGLAMGLTALIGSAIGSAV
jgi:VIT1/CCC1 family predicted Fe2+/Mn2+ transporter